MIKCEKCGKEIRNVSVNFFNRDGSDGLQVTEITECECEAVYMDVNANWTGYGLNEEEMPDTILCPHCGKYPFCDTEIQVYDIVRVVMFRPTTRKQGRWNR